jgi:hypothetical protein
MRAQTGRMKISQGVLICWLRVLETNETNRLRDVQEVVRKGWRKQIDQQNYTCTGAGWAWGMFNRMRKLTVRKCRSE